MSNLAEKLAQLRAEQEQKNFPPVRPVAGECRNESVCPENSEKSFDADLIPELPVYAPNKEDDDVENLVRGIDILDAYARWCGKMSPKVGNKRESIMISCPRTDHPDKVPSAWINLDKQVWHCGGCSDGGDVLTLIARTKNWEGSSYQEGKNFPDLKREIAEDLGYILKKTPGGQSYLEPVTQEPENFSDPQCDPPRESQPASIPPVSSPISSPDSIPHKPGTLTPLKILPDPDQETYPDTLAPIISLTEPEYDLPVIPVIDWGAIVGHETFLYSWMQAMSVDDLPNEFYFFHGLLAIGEAIGRDAILADRHPVLGNLFVCLFGPSGQGKSRSTLQLTRLLKEALPYTYSDPDSTGTYLIPVPGSPESLIDSFARPIFDPTDPKKITRWGKVRGLVRFDELATLIGRASRVGNPLKPALQSFYDGDPHITTGSRVAGNVEAHDAFCSVITTTQPNAIKKIMLASDVDSGFANRWVYVMGHPKTPIPFGGKKLNISISITLLREIRSWAAFGRNLILTPSALERWNEFYRAELDQFHSTEDVLLSRIPLLLKKLLLLLSANAKEDIVSLETVEAMIMLYPYILTTYQYIGGNLGEGERSDLEKAILICCKNLQKKFGRWPTKKDIYSNLARKFRDMAAFKKVVDDMLFIGILDEQISKPKTGRPTVRYAVKE